MKIESARLDIPMEPPSIITPDRLFVFDTLLADDIPLWLRLRQVQRRWQRHCDKCVMPALIVRIRERVERAVGSDLASAIWDNGGITGGYLLDCIMGDTGLPRSDIDVMAKARRIFQFTEDLSYHVPANIRPYLDVAGWSPMGDSVRNAGRTFTTRKYYKGPPLTHRRHHIGPATVTPPTVTPPEFIIDIIMHFLDAREHVVTYDFDFCMNYFDGRSLYIARTESVITGYTNYDEAAATRTSHFEGYDYWTPEPDERIFTDRTTTRARKYAERGFLVGGITA